MKQRLLAAADCVSSLGYTPAYISIYGSQNYGLSVDQPDYRSDYDFKCIVLPSLNDLVMERKPASRTVDTPEGQIDIKDIRVFANVVIKMNPSYLECLSTENALILPGGEQFGEMRTLLLQLMKENGAAFARVCCGLFEEKAKQMRHPYPAAAEKIEKYGYDGKQTHHMYRLLLMLRAFMESGQFRLAVPEGERSLLIDLKLNRVSLEDAEKMITQWRAEMRALRDEIEIRYSGQKDTAAQGIVRLSRSMVYDHCVREARGELLKKRTYPGLECLVDEAEE